MLSSQESTIIKVHSNIIRARFSKRQISLRAQSHKSAGESEMFCVWSTDNEHIKEHRHNILFP